MTLLWIILRKFQWILLLSWHLASVIVAQNDNEYEDNDWVPMAPTHQQKSQKAQSRSLIWNAPNQNYFPENEYVEKQPETQQYLRETTVPNNSNLRPLKLDSPYKFEPVLPLQQPQYVQNQFIQPVPQPQYVQQLPTIQQIPPRPPPQLLSQQLVAPVQQHQNYYDTQRYQSVPQNTLNPGLLNQELLGALQKGQNINPVEQTTTTLKPKEEKETVQLLYVPLENLKPNPVLESTQSQSLRRDKQDVRVQSQRQPQVDDSERQLPRIQHRQPQVDDSDRQLLRLQQHRQSQVDDQQFPRQQQRQPQVENLELPSHRQQQLHTIEDDFITQALAAHKLQQQFQLGQPVIAEPTTTTTVRPTKRKPHQPPLAVYMEKRGQAELTDVLDILKQAKSISVQDTVGPDSPQVFVGPSNLPPIDGYAKFPLPYLSSIQNNRIERKVEQFPFFVAPLSYKTPKGFAKIPLPAPHVGSVIISTKEELHEKLAEPKQPARPQNQIVQDFEIKQPFRQLEQEAKPNSYLVSPNQNALLGTENRFLPGPRDSQNYEISTPRDIPANYQDNQRNYQQFADYRQESRDSRPQYYESRPNYEQIGNIQEQQRVIGAQNAQEELRQYDPSSAIESKNRIISNSQSQIEEFLANAGIQLNEEPIKTTTRPVSTTEFVPERNYRLGQSAYNTRGGAQTDPLGQVINQYEIEQINSQFSDVNDGTTPLRSTTENYNKDDTVPARARTRGRQRGRTTTTSTSTTSESYPETYTVLEEFTIKPKTTTLKYTTDVETIPANVYRLESERLEPLYVQKQAPTSRPNIFDRGPEIQRPGDLSQDPRLSQIQDSLYQIPQTQTQDALNQDSRSRPLIYDRAPNVQVQDEVSSIPSRSQVNQEPGVQSEDQNVDTADELSNINPFLPGYLQNQAVRPLLVPNLLVPTTTERPTTTQQLRVTTTEAPRVEATTQRRTRGRVRANSAVKYTTTAAPRRAVSRRRPANTRATTERLQARTTEDPYDSTRKTVQRQRFRTRGRTETPVQSTPAFKQPALEGGFQGSSYTQYDPADNQRSKTEEYQQYSPSTERLVESSKPIVDVQITHRVPERTEEPIIIQRPTEQFARVQNRVQTDGPVHSRNEDVTRPAVRTRGRTRTRTTSRTPVTRATTTAAPAVKENDDEEFYGFIRKPNFPQASSTEEPLQLYSSSYKGPSKTLIQLDEDAARNDDYSSTTVQFVGEIRPKYTTTEESATEDTKLKNRARIRVPNKPTTSAQQSYNEVKSRANDQASRRASTVRTRNRGTNHFQTPENLRQTADDADVEGGNYPAAYLRNKDLEVNEKSAFQISLDPYDEDDQVPRSSLQSSKILKNTGTQWVEASALPNTLQLQDKPAVPKTEEATTETKQYEEDELTTTTIAETTTTPKPMGKRRGVWKLIRHKPADSIQTAESQDYRSVVNMFDEIEKEQPVDGEVPPSSTTTVSPDTITTSTTTEGSIFDALYKMFDLSKRQEAVNNITELSHVEEMTTTTVQPTFPEEYTQETTTHEQNETTVVPQSATTSTTNVTEVEPWEMHPVRTSTATEVSHETEICYKGKCVKSKEDESTL